MLLTKKSLVKILIMAVCYFILGSVCFALGALMITLGINGVFLLWLGAIVYVLDVLIVFWGRYAEGKGRLINLGNRLVRNELRPAEFINEYENLRSEALVVNKPEMELLQMVAVAYDCLDDREHCLATIEEMIAVARPKKKAFAALIKASFLFSYVKTEEAEKIFSETQKLKLDFMSNALADAIMKGDRAMAMGDYRVVEAYCLRALEQTFPKPDNLTKLSFHYKLGEVYEKLEDNEKAISYYRYCVDYGGETAFVMSSRAAIERLK